MEQNSLLVAIVPPQAFVRVRGRGSFQVSPALKKFTVSAMRQGCRTFVLDMEECEGMDSTFMGVLAGTALRLRKDLCPGEIVMINLDSKNISLLETLGLSKVLQMVKTPLSDDQRRRIGLPQGDQGAMQRLETGDHDRDTAARTMLKAHQDLIRADPENQPRFENVLTYLQEELLRKGADSSTDGEE